jgi:hypothetical protein
MVHTILTCKEITDLEHDSIKSGMLKFTEYIELTL